MISSAALLLGTLAIPRQADAQRPMDLTWTTRDANSFPKDPKWGLQVTQPGSVPDARWCFSLSGWFWNPLCTVQNPSVDTGWGPVDWICRIGSTTPIPGHVNWYASNYTGQIYWAGQSTADRDYNINIVPPNKSGLTTTSGTTIHSEADARETTDNFTVPWWVNFRNASDSTKRTMINGKQAIIGGLMGIDCEHDCQAELHPVWFIAIHIKDDPLDDVWAIYMRNWGNEGFCSRYCHHMLFNGNRSTASLPWRPGATSVSLAAGTIFRSNNSSIYGWWSSSPNQKVDLTFQLPSPSDHGRVHGELHLRWSGANVAAKADPEAPTEPALALTEDMFEDPAEERGGSTAEKLIQGLVEQMTPEQRALFEGELLAVQGPAQRDARSMGLSRTQATRSLPAAAPRLSRVLEPSQIAAGRQTLDALQRAYGGRIPGAIGDALEEYERILKERGEAPQQ